MKIRYEIEHIQFLRTGYLLMNTRDLSKAFSAFCARPVSEKAVKSILQNHQITCGRKPKDRLINRVRMFTPIHVKFLKKQYVGRSVNELTRVFNAKFNMNMTRQQIRTAVHNRGFTSGRTGQFEKGQRPWNAGTKGQGIMRPNKTSFKKGHVPPNRRPLGSERVCSKDGFILIKVAEKDPHTGFPTRFKHKHVHVWEQANGPVPEGMVVAFQDGNKLNITIENLMLISRAELLRLNKHGYKNAPDELKPSILALAKLETKTFQMEKKAA